MTQLHCIWCGSLGGFANELRVELDTYGNAIAECDWCWSSDYFRKLASNGKQ